MKTKDLLNAWKSFLEKDVINEISIERFQGQHPDFNTSGFSSQLRGNTDYLDIISNSINAGQNHGPNEYIQQFDFYKNSIAPQRNNKDFLTINIPGDDPVSLYNMVRQGSCTATYDDIQQFQQARMFTLGKGSKNKLIAAYEKVINESLENDFEIVAEDSNWIIFYPKSTRGSIALARSYWDGEKIVYDKTFNTSRGFGQNSGKMNWCTSVSGAGNMFLTHHRQLNLHMYYCIKKNLSSVNDVDRKLCISLAKTKNKVTFKGQHASVNGNNSPISEASGKQYIGALYDVLIKDAKQEKRLEIDPESYYRSISIEQYIIMREANEENINDFIPELYGLISYSKDSEKIVNHCVHDKRPEIREYIGERYGYRLSPQDLEILAHAEEESVRASVANTICDHYFKQKNKKFEGLALSLVNDVSEKVRLKIAESRNISVEILEILANDISEEVVKAVATNTYVSEEILIKIINSNPENAEIVAVASKNSKLSNEAFLRIFDSNILPITSQATLVLRGAQQVYGNYNSETSTWHQLLSDEKILNVFNEVKRSGLMSLDILKNFSHVEIEEIYLDIVEFCEANSRGNKRKVQDLLLRILTGNGGTEEVINKIYNMTNDKKIIGVIARNINTPIRILKELLSTIGQQKGGKNIRIAIAGNYNLPLDMLEELSYDNAHNVRYIVAYNPNVSVEILERLSKDTVKKVSKVAKNALKKRNLIGSNKKAEGLSAYISKSENNLRSYIKLVLS